MIFKLELTPEKLTDEYVKWMAVNGHGRDSQDQRFGQHIVNNYYNRRSGESFPELFYEEDAHTAYNIAYDRLLDR